MVCYMFIQSFLFSDRLHRGIFSFNKQLRWIFSAFYQYCCTLVAFISIIAFFNFTDMKSKEVRHELKYKVKFNST